MDACDIRPIEYFNRWFAEPIDVLDDTVRGHIEALERHASAADQTAQDYVMPIRRCREHAGRFRIWGENQDTFYCFVYDGDELERDPPVYFESCLDLVGDYGLDPTKVIDGNHILVAEKFSDFLWHMLGHHICLRCESGNQFQPNVCGVLFDETAIDESFTNPVGREFPAGYSPFFKDDTICIPDWGAVFYSADSRANFVARHRPNIRSEWA